MDLGSTIAVFLIVAAGIMLLFCLLIKYFSSRLKRERQLAENANLMEESILKSNEQIVEGAYEQFLYKRQIKREIEMKEMSIDEGSLVQTPDIRQKFDITNNIYGLTKLRQRLDSDTIPLQQQKSDTQRSLPSIKSFNISRLNTMQTQKQRHFHSYVQKLIAYTAKGLTIIQADVVSLKKIGEEQYELNQIVDENIIEYTSEHYLDQLEVNGFYANIYGYYKFTNSIDVTQIKTTEIVPLKAFKVNSSKQAIQEDVYLKEREKLLGKAT